MLAKYLTPSIADYVDKTMTEFPQEILITTLCLESLKKPEVNLRPGRDSLNTGLEVKNRGM